MILIAGRAVESEVIPCHAYVRANKKSPVVSVEPEATFGLHAEDACFQCVFEIVPSGVIYRELDRPMRLKIDLAGDINPKECPGRKVGFDIDVSMPFRFDRKDGNLDRRQRTDYRETRDRSNSG